MSAKSTLDTMIEQLENSMDKHKAMAFDDLLRQCHSNVQNIIQCTQQSLCELQKFEDRLNSLRRIVEKNELKTHGEITEKTTKKNHD